MFMQERSGDKRKSEHLIDFLAKDWVCSNKYNNYAHNRRSLNISKNKILDVNGDKAQITIDYAAGIGIFLITVTFVFQFMYALFLPFQSGPDEVSLAADRIATVIVERMLTLDNAMTSNVIDERKLIYFNNIKLNQSNATVYLGTLRELGLLSDENVFDLNITVANITTPNNFIYKSGPQLPDTADIGQTKRLIYIVNPSTGYNATAYFSVRVW
ncbi:Uncharacterised protein [uncultured archaeon]|nr:Uncharacterised protein [uncultured archaeon]